MIVIQCNGPDTLIITWNYEVHSWRSFDARIPTKFFTGKWFYADVLLQSEGQTCVVFYFTYDAYRPREITSVKYHISSGKTLAYNLLSLESVPGTFSKEYGLPYHGIKMDVRAVNDFGSFAITSWIEDSSTTAKHIRNVVLYHEQMNNLSLIQYHHSSLTLEGKSRQLGKQWHLWNTVMLSEVVERYEDDKAVEQGPFARLIDIEMFQVKTESIAAPIVNTVLYCPRTGSLPYENRGSRLTLCIEGNAHLISVYSRYDTGPRYPNTLAKTFFFNCNKDPRLPKEWSVDLVDETVLKKDSSLYHDRDENLHRTMHHRTVENRNRKTVIEKTKTMMKKVCTMTDGRRNTEDEK